MTNRVVILIDANREKQGVIDWSLQGVVVNEIAELYQEVKDRQVDLILVDEQKRELNHAVAVRLRRPHGLTEIWRIVASEFSAGEDELCVDGHVSRELGADGIAQKIADILAEKELLEEYGMVGRSSQIKNVARTIQRIAPTEVSILIVGPSGSGKEIVARALHNSSSRKGHPFVAINCGAIAEGILESELFGHEKGAFTGSVAKREGLFAKADGGTIFLDEIGETKQDTQVKLLRVLEDGTYYPVGSSSSRKANVRVLAATNRDLTEAIADRLFREDLYFRIGVVKIILPSLLDRKEDIQPLLQFFWSGNKGLDYSDSALDLLMRYDWPGNVRQLRNFASRMAALKPKGLVDASDVERFLNEQNASATHLPVTTGKTVEEAGQELIYRAILSLGTEIRLLRDLITAHLPGDIGAATFEGPVEPAVQSMSMEEMERRLIQKILTETDGNRKETAKRLGIGERTLYRKLNKYKLN
jgi:DNA-binding NtrC family response regulator